MDIAEVLAGLGGVARTDQLTRHLPFRALTEAVEAGRVERLAPGRYGLASAAASHRAAMRLGGAVAGLSAAIEHRWPVLREPDRPWVCVPVSRTVAAHRRRGVRLLHGDVDGGVTSPLRTVVDCGRRLPLTEALAVADSALRSGTVDHDELVTATSGLRGPGAATAMRAARSATPLAATPLESALRALSLGVTGLHLVPQTPLEIEGVTLHPDLYDARLGLVVEAEGWLYHGAPRQFAHDLWRYTAMTVAGLTVVRFGHDAVTHRADWVVDCLESLSRGGSRALTGPRKG